MTGISGATHLAVGFSKGLMSDFDRCLPAGSVAVVEEPDVIGARRVAERLAAHPSTAVLVPAPIHAEADPDGVIAALARVGGIKAVIPAVEYGVVAAAAVAAHRGLPGAGLTAARVLRDKVELRTRADAAGLPQPRWREAESPDDVAAFLGAAGRCVLKPANRQASLGVVILAPGDDVAAAWSQASTVSEPRMRAERGTPRRHLVEEYLAGPEISAEALVDSGEVVFTNVTAKTVLPGPWPVELGHVVPAPLPDRVADDISDLMGALAEAVGFGTGVLHAEWILLDGHRPHLVECAGRLPGDSIDELIDLAYGGSIAADFIALLEGSRPARPRIPARAAAIRFLSGDDGVVERIDGLDEAVLGEGVHEAVVSAVPGDVLRRPTSSWDRVGHVIATGQDAQAALDRVRQAAARIDVVVR
ncbi:biotin carboxylase [Catenulispora sp. GP43]|uniref:ATP-grasp domain-containing protein n=1 Tax=Catenulispora sp. GP43 TaxID=3156263 RepID=UPI003516A8F3